MQGKLTREAYLVSFSYRVQNRPRLDERRSPTGNWSVTLEASAMSATVDKRADYYLVPIKSPGPRSELIAAFFQGNTATFGGQCNVEGRR
jgi:hypothetical protein